MAERGDWSMISPLRFLVSGLAKRSQARRRLSSCKPLLEELERRELLATTLSAPLHFDFGTLTSPVAAGYTGVPPIAYSSSLGYGWSNVSGITVYDRGTTNPLTTDFNAGHNGTFLANLPDGTYNVTVYLGDAKYQPGPVSIWLEGQKVASRLTTQPGQFITPTYQAQVSGGQLSMRLAASAGSNSYFALDALDINSVTTAPASSSGSTALVANAGPYLTTSE